jgi:hypothetical protein
MTKLQLSDLTENDYELVRKAAVAASIVDDQRILNCVIYMVSSRYSWTGKYWTSYEQRKSQAQRNGQRQR